MENSILNSLVALDKKVLIFLNSFGSESWDPFWLFITKQFNWMPLFVLLLLVMFYKLGLKKTLLTLLFLAVVITISDQFTNLIKYLTGRTRPCNVPELQQYLRQFSYKPRGKSFWSGHAFVSTTVTTFLVLLLRKHTRYIYFLIFFPIIFGYSRIYLGVHFPIDVTTGYIMGFTFGSLFFMLHRYLFNRFISID